MNKIIQVDFDGTIATKNIGLALQKYYAVDKGRFEYLRDAFNKREMDVVEVVQAGWANTDCTEQEFLRKARIITKYRKGFLDFISAARYKGFTPVIVSGGLTFYIETLIDLVCLNESSFISPIPIIAGEAIFYKNTNIPHNRVKVFMPYDNKLAFAKEFHPLVYIGDGYTDIAPSVYAQYVFAVEGRDLSKGIADAIPFSSFESITNRLDSLEV